MWLSKRRNPWESMVHRGSGSEESKRVEETGSEHKESRISLRSVLESMTITARMVTGAREVAWSDEASCLFMKIGLRLCRFAVA